ncbi:MAG: sigma 54-interacting transcriptional regulator [Acidobacteriota bacterium]
MSSPHDRSAPYWGAEDRTADSLEQLETMTRSAVLSGCSEERIALANGLTLMAHPDLRRIGERSPLVALSGDGEVPLSRLEPLFAHPGESRRRPLADPHISRRALSIRADAEGGVILDNPFQLKVTVAGEPLGGPRSFTATEIESGVPILLAGRILLMLHPMETLSPAEPSYGLVGESRGMGTLRRQIQRVADLEVPVLLRGETGTGKELVARSIHRASNRRRGSMVAVNMGAMTPSLAAAELFGSVKGAFTGAERRRSGFFVEAHGGTLFLDEIGETPSAIQPMLLRTLETHRVRPVGAEKEESVDVRILAATDAHLEDAIEAGEFRAPLLHRLSGYEIRIPPLRDRREDIPRLLLHFLRIELEAIGEAWRLDEPPAKRPWLPATLVARFVDFDWPGNIRQLRNAARQLLISNRGAARLRLSRELEELFDSHPEEETAEIPTADGDEDPVSSTEVPVSTSSAATSPERLGDGPHQPVVRTLVAVRWRRQPAPADPKVFRQRARRDEVVRRLLIEYDGHEVEHGEGFLLLFKRPVDGLGFALEVHDSLDALAERLGHGGGAAIAVFVGEIFVRANPPDVVARGASPFDVAGAAKSAAQRLASAALAHQTLLNQSAFDLARQALTPDHPLRATAVSWVQHGTYSFETDDMEVFEVGLRDRAPLTPPPATATVDRIPGPARASYRSPDTIGEEELIEALRRHAFRVLPTAKTLGISRTSLYALIDRFPRIRKASEIPPGEIEACLSRHGGDRTAAAAELEVSQKGLSRRMTELGM